MVMDTWSRRQFLALSTVTISSLLLAGFAVDVFSTELFVKRLSVQCNKRQTPLKIAHFSDIHISPYIKNTLIEKLIRIINLEKPDLVIYTGDTIYKEYGEYDKIEDVFSRLQAKSGKIAVLGNHDYSDGKNAELVKYVLNKAGIEVLKDQSLSCMINGEPLHITGLADLMFGWQDLPKAFKASPTKDLHICLSHNPSNIADISHYQPDIVLAGHTHGGQLYLPFLLKDVYRQFYNPDYVKGLFTVNNSKMYVNSGLATTPFYIPYKETSFPVKHKRLFSPPELTIYTIS